MLLVIIQELILQPWDRFVKGLTKGFNDSFRGFQQQELKKDNQHARFQGSRDVAGIRGLGLGFAWGSDLKPSIPSHAHFDAVRDSVEAEAVGTGFEQYSTQRVHIHYHYGIKGPKTVMGMVFRYLIPYW